MCSLNFMLLSSLIEEMCTKEEINKAGCTLTFGGQCISHHQLQWNSALTNGMRE